MKVLIVSNGIPPSSIGGVEVYTHDLSKGLYKRGIDVVVFARESDPKLADYTLNVSSEDGFRVYRVISDYKQVKTFEQLFLDNQIDEIYTNILRGQRPDIVIFNHLIALSANLPLITSREGFPYILYLHDFWTICQRVNLLDYQNQVCPGPKRGGDCFRCLTPPINNNWRQRLSHGILLTTKYFISSRLRQWLRNLLKTTVVTLYPSSPSTLEFRYKVFKEGIERSKLILVPSLYLRRVFEQNQFPSKLIKVLPLGIMSPQEKRTEGKRENTFYFGYVGNIIPAKGVHILLEAFQATENNFYLLIFGRYIDPAYMNRLLGMKGNNERIKFLGEFEPKDRDNIYAKFDCLIIPSVVPESFSLVAREALIRGIPVIASNIGALCEVIIPGENGLLVKPNSVADLQKAIESIPNTKVKKGNISPTKIMTVDEHLDVFLDYIRPLARGQSKAFT